MTAGNFSDANKASGQPPRNTPTSGDPIFLRLHSLHAQMDRKTPNPPVIRRITELNSNDHLIRQSNRAKLDPDSIEACKECPKPVWFTAFFDGTGNNQPDQFNHPRFLNRT